MAKKKTWPLGLQASKLHLSRVKYFIYETGGYNVGEVIHVNLP